MPRPQGTKNNFFIDFERLFLAAPCMDMPGSIKNGRVRFHRRQHGDLAKYSCNSGYKLEGPKYIVCLYSIWTKAPKCDPGIRATIKNVCIPVSSWLLRSFIIFMFIIINPIIATLKPQRNGPTYSNTVIGTLAVDGWLWHYNCLWSLKG